MARVITQCSTCDGLLWFDDEQPPPQAAICPCGSTELKETGPEGTFTEPTVADKEQAMYRLGTNALQSMRAIFDSRSINRPRHCFRWSNQLARWELYEVAPANRTLIAYRDAGEWVEV